MTKQPNKTLTPCPSPLTGRGVEGVANSEALSQRGVFKYNMELKERARELRKNPTDAEKKLWDEFLQERPGRYKFLRQKPVGNYILDFYCSELLLAIEVDGKIHSGRKEYDGERDNFLEACGIKVVRISNDDIQKDFENAKKHLNNVILSQANLSSVQFPLLRGKGGWDKISPIPPVKGDKGGY